MFRRLHLQMTFFAASITSLILITLTCVCLFISENSLRENDDTSFSKEINSIIIHLQGQNSVSLQWINQLQESSGMSLYFYDNGSPLYVTRLYTDDTADGQVSDAIAYARSQYNIDIANAPSEILPSHAEFSLTDASGNPYAASVGVIPKEYGSFGFVILHPLTDLYTHITSQRFGFGMLDAAAIALLVLFAWFFTGRMLLPLEENRKKQIHFISAASHELRAPLAVMLSGADAMHMADNAHERTRFFHMIKEEGTRMQHLIADLLFLSRSDSGNFPVQVTPCQPELLLLDAYEKYELYAHKKKLSLSISLPKEQLPDCIADHERVAQIFSILLDNAFSYTPEGGTVTLTLRACRRSGSGGKHATAKLTNRSFACFTVSDSGPGVPDIEKPLIFDRFYRAQSSHTDKNHFGLGLCIAREIAQAHHGRLYVKDAPGGGAAFVLELPLA